MMNERTLVTGMARYWWAFILRGVLAIGFGVAAFVWPDVTLVVLVFLFAAWVFVDGIFALIGALTGGETATGWNRWLMGILGVVSIAAGLLAFFWPAITAVVLAILISSWAIVTGVFQIVAAIMLRREINNEWLLILAGAASVIFGVLIFLFPLSGLLTIVWLIALYAIVFGILLIGLGWRLRGVHQDRRSAATS
jgi:uncharacterized membrane protein HdeD (DUF308 family)